MDSKSRLASVGVRNIPQLLLTTALGLVMHTGAVWAEEAPAAEASSDIIIVTGQGLRAGPASPAYGVTDIERDDLLTAASGRIEDALSSAAGFQQFRRSDSRSANPSAQGVTLRSLGGNATSRTLVLLDGVPMADPFFGYIPLSAMAPERLAAARVTRGGGAGAFGAGAVAGTIELTSANADELGIFNGSMAINDRSETELSGTVAPSIGDGFAVISGRWDRGQGFWTTPESQRVPASARAQFDNWSVGGRLVMPLSQDVELQLRTLMFEDNRTLRYEGADSDSAGRDLSVRLVGHGPWEFDILAYAQERNFSNMVISSSSYNRVLDQYATPSSGWGGKVELRPPVGDNQLLRFGADMRIATGEGSEIAYNGGTGAVTARRRAGGTNRDFGFFVENDWLLGALTLTAGARADYGQIEDGHFISRNAAGVITSAIDYDDRSDWTGSFRAGAVYEFNSGLEVRAAAYTGLRQPTLNELYRSFTVFPVVTSANSELKNEELVGYEIGVDYKPFSALTLSFTAFDNQVDDAIANVTIGVNQRERQNVDAVHSRGLEIGANYEVGDFNFHGSVALTDAEVEGSGDAAALDGMRPAQTPDVAASLSLAWSPAANWLFSGTVRYVGEQYEDDLETNVLADATTLDAFAQMPISDTVSFVLRGENLTDEDVMTRNQSGSIDLGAPRTIWAGLRMSLR